MAAAAGTRSDIRDFGAAVDAKPAVNAAAIQRAIDGAEKAGGGTVVVPAGTFTSGTIWLKRNVELHLAEGSVLKASGDLADYNRADAYPENWGCPPEYWNGCHFIIARQADGASITGGGTIHGNGDAFYDDEPRAYYSWMKPGSHAWWNGIRWASGGRRTRRTCVRGSWSCSSSAGTLPYAASRSGILRAGRSGSGDASACA